MNIDGHDIRKESIDGATEIFVVTKMAQEGTDYFAIAEFEIFVRGIKLRIARSKRYRSNDGDHAKAAAIEEVRLAVKDIRDPVAEVLT